LDQGTWTAVSCQSPVTRTGSHRPSVAMITVLPMVRRRCSAPAPGWSTTGNWP